MIPLEIFVADSGPGISPEEIKELFVPFRRLKSSKSTTGSGLGLTICKLITTSMNAQIDVDSELGVGSTFSIYLRALTFDYVPVEFEGAEEKRAKVFGGEMGSSLALIEYLEQIGLDVRQGERSDLEVFDPKEQVMEGVDVVFAFPDPIGDDATFFYERSKTPVCRVRWLSDSQTFDCDLEYTLVRPFSRSTVIEFLNDLFHSTSASRLSTVDRWRSTFAERYPLSVVVAEDDPVSMEVLVGMLEKLGFSPEQATDGEEAIRLIKQSKPDVAIVDMHMPKCTGLEVIERCRECDVWWVVSSAGSNVLTKENAGVYGYNDLLSKPLNIDAVRNALQRAGDSIFLNKPSEGISNDENVAPKKSPHEQMREIYANDPERLANLISSQIDQTDEFVQAMTTKVDDPLSDEDVRRMAHTLRSSASFAGATETAALATTIDKDWEHMTLDQRKNLIFQLKEVWDNRERHQLVDEINEIKRTSSH